MAQFSYCSPTSLDRMARLPVRTAVAVLLTVIVFKLVFSCPCTAPAETVLHCWLYLLLPVGIVFFILALLDPRLLKACQCFGCRCCVGSGSRCSECCCCCCAAGHSYRPASCCGEEGRYFCALIFGHVLNVFYAASLWIVVAFLDGDWYVCVRTAVENGTGEQIACKDLPTPQEAETLRKYNSESRIIGLILILGLSFLLTVSSSLKACWKPYYKSLYEVYVEQETSAMLEEKLREQAVERAKLMTENAIKNIQNQPVNSGQGDARHVQYQPIGVADENVWRTISHPTFHLMGVRTHP